VGEPRTWKRAQSVLGKGRVRRGKVTWPNKWNSLFVTIKCIKALPYKLHYFENAEFYFFQRPNFDDETLLIINKPKYPKMERPMIKK
jgi:hypothetical protein